MQITIIDFDTIRVEPQVCVEQSVIDANMVYAIANIKDRIAPGIDQGLESVAVVCYGPSLLQEWEKLRNFRYIITCSGAHKFLVERGIIPTWHVEADPRAHKITLMGDPHPDVEYLIASSCSPQLIDHLRGHRIRLWHVYRGEEINELPQNYPRGEWVFSGGSSAGLRSLILAKFLGFRKVDVFGMDCSYPRGHGGEHAGTHPNPSAESNRINTMFDKCVFHTTPNLIYYAKEFFRELSLINDVEFVVHGIGLLQRMVQANYRDPSFTGSQRNTLMAVCAAQVISPEYRRLNQELHQQSPSYGTSGHFYAPVLRYLTHKLGTRDVLDYGCGKGTLAQSLDFVINEYDPCIAGKDHDPRPADIVVCGDVLEHVEPDFLNYVIGDIARCTKMLAYVIIHTGAATKTLSDGRNAHLIQQDRVWWHRALEKVFVVDDCRETGNKLEFFCRPRTLQKQAKQVGNVLVNEGISFVNANANVEWRVRTLMTKEPVTIQWLDSLSTGDILVDVGANVGCYSLYAAVKKKIRTYAFEPEAQNYAILNQNISLNKIPDICRAYCLALSDNIKLGDLYLTNMVAGESCHQFDRRIGFNGNDLTYGFQQGSFSVTLDWLVSQNMIPQPTHIKIDVDGIEDRVCAGASQTLDQVRSVLVEVNANLPQHQQMVKNLISKGFSYDPDQVQRSTRRDGAFEGVAEYVFTKTGRSA